MLCLSLARAASLDPAQDPADVGDAAALTADIVALALQYGRNGYRRIAALLMEAGGTINRKRVEQIWRRDGLKAPAMRPKSKRLSVP